MFLAPFKIANVNFQLPQNFLAHFADRRSQNGHSFRGIPVENGQKILMDKAFVGIAPAADSKAYSVLTAAAFRKEAPTLNSSYPYR